VTAEQLAHEAAAAGQFLVVRLEADLPTYRVNGLVMAIRQHPGIASVTDLAAISRETLDRLLLPTAAAKPRQRRGKHAA
jgi:DNA-binding phage protein